MSDFAHTQGAVNITCGTQWVPFKTLIMVTVAAATFYRHPRCQGLFWELYITKAGTYSHLTHEETEAERWSNILLLRTMPRLTVWTPSPGATSPEFCLVLGRRWALLGYLPTSFFNELSCRPWAQRQGKANCSLGHWKRHLSEGTERDRTRTFLQGSFAQRYVDRRTAWCKQSSWEFPEVQWLGLGAFTAMAQVQFLVEELRRSCKLCSATHLPPKLGNLGTSQTQTYTQILGIVVKSGFWLYSPVKASFSLISFSPSSPEVPIRLVEPAQPKASPPTYGNCPVTPRAQDWGQGAARGQELTHCGQWSSDAAPVTGGKGLPTRAPGSHLWGP